MKKIRILAIFAICIVLGTSLNQPVYASLGTDTPIAISPRYTHIASTMTTLANASGKASCSAIVYGISSSSSLKIFIYLEKNINGTWVTQASDYKTKTGSSLTLGMNVAVGSGTYRVRASYHCNGENIIQYSAEKKF